MGKLYIQETVGGKNIIEVGKAIITNYNSKQIEALEVVLGGVAEQLIQVNGLTIDKGLLTNAVHTAYVNTISLNSYTVSVNSTLSVTCMYESKTDTYNFDIITYSTSIMK